LQALDDIDKGTVRGTRVPALGKLCLARMATAQMRKRTWAQYKKGVIREFVVAQQRGGERENPQLINEFPG